MKKKFIIEAEMEERWIPHFMSMLKHMERLGEMGSSRKVTLYSDGDGDFRPKFNADIEFEIKPPVEDDGDYVDGVCKRCGNRLYDAG